MSSSCFVNTNNAIIGKKLLTMLRQNVGKGMLTKNKKGRRKRRRRVKVRSRKMRK